MDPGFWAHIRRVGLLVLSSLTPSSVGASLAVHDYNDQIILLSFQMGAIGVSYLFSPGSSLGQR
jgi:hypothetical protein